MKVFVRIVAAFALVSVSACEREQPVSVPADFSGPVSDLVKQVEPTASVAVGGHSCRTIMDEPDRVLYYADAQLNVPADVAASKLREAGIRAGWQPFRSDVFALVLMGKAGDLAVKDVGGHAVVRAERDNCSVDSDQQLDTGISGPDVTAAQTKAMDRAYSVVKYAAGAIGKSLHIDNLQAGISRHDDEEGESVCETPRVVGMKWADETNFERFDPQRSGMKSIARTVEKSLGSTWRITRRSVLSGGSQLEAGSGDTTLHIEIQVGTKRTKNDPSIDIRGDMKCVPASAK